MHLPRCCCQNTTVIMQLLIYTRAYMQRSDLEKDGSGAWRHLVVNHAILRTFWVKYPVLLSEDRGIKIEVQWLWIEDRQSRFENSMMPHQYLIHMFLFVLCRESRYFEDIEIFLIFPLRTINNFFQTWLKPARNYGKKTKAPLVHY